MKQRALPRSRQAIAVALRFASVSVSALALAQSDNFDDGNDAGWTHYSPLSAFGAGAAYTYPSGSYRVAAPASPAPDQLGPQRAGSLRQEKTYSRIQLATDILDWNNGINQSLGLIARVGNLGIGTTTGYTYNYNTVSGFHQLNLVLNEAATRQVNESPFKVNPRHRYRMVFTLVGTQLLGQMFSATNAAVPLHSVFGRDDNHESGTAGLFAFALDALGPIDARFDNYSAAVPAKVRATLLDANPAAGEQPELPIESVGVRLASLETSINLPSIRLEVDGQVVAFELAEELGYLRLVYTPPAPLNPVVAHVAKVSFDDEDGTQSFDWPFGAPAAPAAVLLAAATPAGGFEPTPDAEFDAASRTFRVSLTGAARFFRVSDATVRRIIRTVPEGTKLAITIE